MITTNPFFTALQNQKLLFKFPAQNLCICFTKRQDTFGSYCHTQYLSFIFFIKCLTSYKLLLFKLIKMGSAVSKNGLIETDPRFQVIHRSRKGKKLLVLDLDKTLCDVGSSHPRERPHLHQFLKEMYKTFDIIIWSATPISVVEDKLIWLGVLNKRRYKIMCYIGVQAMTTIRLPENKVVQTKPLRVIWNKFPQYNAGNTIIVDDKEKNFMLNKNNGLLIKKFESGNYQTDEELFLLISYLSNIGTHSSNFLLMNHSQWKRNITS